MTKIIRRLAERAYGSAAAWSLVFTAIRAGGNLLVLPLMLRKLASQELGLWYVFLSLSGISSMIDLGFSPTMTRVTAFIWAGAKEIQPIGIAPIPEDQPRGAEPNYGLLAELVKTMRLYYAAAGMAVTAVLAIGGTIWILGKAHTLPNSHWVLAAWFLFLPGVLVNTTSSMWHPLLSGINEVRLNQQIFVVGLVANYGILLVGLLCGTGLFAPVAGYFFMGVITRSAARSKFRGLTRAAAYESLVRGSTKMLRTLWPTAWRTGIVTLGIYATINLNTLICSANLGLAATASYGLSLQLALAAMSIASTFILVKLPLFAQMNARGEVHEISRLAFARLRWFWLVYVGLALAAILFGQPVLNNVLHSKTPLMGTSLLIGLFIVIGLEGHHALFREITLTSHRNPFAPPVIISAALIVLLSLTLVRWIGLWGLILAPGVVQLCFNNWWTVLVGLNSMGNSFGDYLRGLFGQRRSTASGT